MSGRKPYNVSMAVVGHNQRNRQQIRYEDLIKTDGIVSEFVESRRALLRMAGLAAAIGSFGMFVPWCNAQEKSKNDPGMDYDLAAAEVVGEYTSTTLLIISFGSAFGGFEFAMQLRYDIMQSVGKSWNDDPAFVYLDAESLKQQARTTYSWDERLGIYKMANPFWKVFYRGAMEHAKTMIFLLTEPWLSSPWCWEEFEWYIERFAAGQNLRPVFVVFPDAAPLLQQREIVGQDGRKRNPKQIWDKMQEIPDSCTIFIKTLPFPELTTVTIEGAPYTYQYRYACSEAELQAIFRCLQL